MKKLVLGIFSLLLVMGGLHAQDGKKALRDATKALGVYNLDPSGNKAKLTEAYTEVQVALKDSEIAASSKVWQANGDILNEVASQLVAVRQLGVGSAEDYPSVENPAIDAMNSYATALDVSQKKFELKDALKGLRATQGNLYNMGIYAYEDQKYEVAFDNFEKILDAHKLLKANDYESSLDKKEDLDNQMYITSLAALNAGKMKESAAYIQPLMDGGFDKPVIYEVMYKIKAEETSAEEAYKFLEEGRTKFPDDVSLLFAEINHYLAINNLDALIDKLKDAIEKEPTNISLYSTLGNVYDNLFQKQMEAGDEAKAQEYFDNALKYYEEALEKDPDYVDVIYSVGALYYNKAAQMTQALNKLADDYSKEGIKKYNELNDEILVVFDQALPYFQTAESKAPNDINTLIALKEIFARKSQLDLSNEFKTRLETVQDGGTNESSFFKQ